MKATIISRARGGDWGRQGREKGGWKNRGWVRCEEGLGSRKGRVCGYGRRGQWGRGGRVGGGEGGEVRGGAGEGAAKERSEYVGLWNSRIAEEQ